MLSAVKRPAPVWVALVKNSSMKRADAPLAAVSLTVKGSSTERMSPTGLGSLPPRCEEGAATRVARRRAATRGRRA